MVSNVWSYFTKVPDENSVKCKICNKRLTHNTSSTGSMHNHLKLKHPTIKLESEQSEPRFRQQTVSGMLSHMNQQCSGNRSSKITELIREVLIENFLPFSVVDSESFKKLFNYLEPGYNVPSRVSFSNQIQKIYEDKKEKLIEKFNEIDYFSITTDSWMSLNSQSFSTVTGHFISRNWKLESVVLSTKHEPEDHTAENLQKSLDSVLQEFKIENKAICCVHDNATNISRAASGSAFLKFDLNCVAHCLQLSINKGLNSNQQIQTTIGAASRLVAHFKHSYKATGYLATKQQQLKVEQHKLIQRNNTRWNSTYDMFKRLLEQRWPICAVLSDRHATKLSDARTLELKDEHWRIMEDLIAFLQPLKVATTQLSQDSHVSLSLVVPILLALVNNHLNVTENDSVLIKKFKSTVKDDIASRFPSIFAFDVEQQPELLCPYLIASFLDPKHKHFQYYDETQKEFIYRSISKLLQNLDPNPPNQSELSLAENDNGGMFLLISG